MQDSFDLILFNLYLELFALLFQYLHNCLCQYQSETPFMVSFLNLPGVLYGLLTAAAA